MQWFKGLFNLNYFLYSLNNFLRVIIKCNAKNIRLNIEDDLWICEILWFPIFMPLNDFRLVKIPEIIVINREASNPMFMIFFRFFLRVYFPLCIDLKNLLLYFKCNAIKNNNPIPTISWIRIGMLRNSTIIAININMSTVIFLFIKSPLVLIFIYLTIYILFYLNFFYFPYM